MRTKIKEVSGLDWFDGAVMNCKWRGPLLRDVLERAGIDPGLTTAHVAFASYQVECQDDTWYGGSIPLERALNPAAEVLVALEMNGEPLSPEHGSPVRIVVPGVAGARSVKWLDQITVQSKESQNHYQRYDYKVLPPEATDMDEANKFWDDTPAVQAMPVNSIVGHPSSEKTVSRDANGTIAVAGYALPSGDCGPVVKVEVSGDGGREWTQAGIVQHPENSKWSWVLWNARVPIEKGDDVKVISRATDAAGNTQPEESQWNLRGVCYNGYGSAEGLKVE
jgi:sulfite oxidase